MTTHHDRDPRRPATAEEEALLAYAAALNEEPPAWFTASQYEPKVGDRVRVSVGECEAHWSAKDSPDMELAQGQTGVVIPWTGSRPTHHVYTVRYDHPFISVVVVGTRTVAGHFAAIELELLTPATGAAGRAADEGEGR